MIMTIFRKISASICATSKRIAILFLLPLFFSFSNSVFAEEVVIYDAAGQYVGFFDPALDSIYLSSGEPVAYIDKGTGAVYGYDGRYLGWYRDGVIRDTNGYVIGFSERSAPKTVRIQRVENVQFVRKPIPSVPREVIRVETPPQFTDTLSPTPFSNVFVYPYGSEAVR